MNTNRSIFIYGYFSLAMKAGEKAELLKVLNWLKENNITILHGGKENLYDLMQICAPEAKFIGLQTQGYNKDEEQHYENALAQHQPRIAFIVGGYMKDHDILETCKKNNILPLGGLFNWGLSKETNDNIECFLSEKLLEQSEDILTQVSALQKSPTSAIAAIKVLEHFFAN